MSHDVLELLAAANPAPESKPIPAAVWSPTELRGVIDHLQHRNEEPMLWAERSLGRRSRVTWPVVLGVALVMAAVVIPSLIFVFGPEDPVEPVNTTLPTNLTTFPGEPEPSGELDTPAGAIKWRYLAGSPASMPGSILSTPHGYVGLSGQNEILTSSDGVDWVAHTDPAPNLEADLFETGDGYWATFTQYNLVGYTEALWHSADGLTWTEIPLGVTLPRGVRSRFFNVDEDIFRVVARDPLLVFKLVGSSFEILEANTDAFSLPGVIGSSTFMDWQRTHVGTPASLLTRSMDRLTIVPWTMEGVVADIPGLDPNARSFWYVDGYTSSGDLRARDHFQTEPSGVRPSEAALPVPDEWTVRHSHAVINLGGVVRSVTPPWGSDTHYQVIAVDGQFVALVGGDGVHFGPTEAWTSDDGIQWEGPITSSLPDGVFHAQPVGNGAIGTTGGRAGWPILWASFDGIDWFRTGVEGGGSLMPLGGGGIWFGTEGAYASNNLRYWQSIDIGAMGIPEDASGVTLENGDFLIRAERTGRTMTWVVESAEE